ncbi:MAG TPA: hypothetical protein VFB14_22030 [Bryobacteraceae bacterium]|jgi:hypothetical protein|nr:hypothetical protein [Bryobacteraceae bacterium]
MKRGVAQKHHPWNYKTGDAVLIQNSLYVHHDGVFVECPYMPEVK